MRVGVVARGEPGGRGVLDAAAVGGHAGLGIGGGDGAVTDDVAAARHADAGACAICRGIVGKASGHWNLLRDCSGIGLCTLRGLHGCTGTGGHLKVSPGDCSPIWSSRHAVCVWRLGDVDLGPGGKALAPKTGAY